MCVTNNIKLTNKDKTILEQIFELKIIQPYSCLNGICGACKKKNPVSGKYVYIDDPIACIPEGMFLPCVAKIDPAESHIVLEVEDKSQKTG